MNFIKIRVKLYSKPTDKIMSLDIIKAIKIFTRMGLKECKEFVDNLQSTGFITCDGVVDNEELKQIKSLLHKSSIKFEIIDRTQLLRDKKLIEIGIIDELDRYDIAKELVEQDISEWLKIQKINSTIDIKKLLPILVDRYSKLELNYLLENLTKCA